MSLQIIKDSPPEGQFMTVVVRGNDRDDFEGKTALELAKTHAIKRGFIVSGVSNNPQVYPVDETDEATADVCFGSKPAAGYIKTFQFGASL